ncbi:MAG TPA: hypothetical protein PLP42_04755 [Acidobacteriota bacterium]|nr:hypothetical protein [Acidobacteriota bacterium]
MSRRWALLVGLGVAFMAFMLLLPQLESAEEGGTSKRKNSLFEKFKTPKGASSSFLLPAGTRLHVRLKESVTERNRSGDTFVGNLDRPLQTSGAILAPAGSRVIGRLTQLKESDSVESTEVSMVLEQIVVDDEVYCLSSKPLTLLIPVSGTPSRKTWSVDPGSDRDVLYETDTRLTFALAEHLRLPECGLLE